MSPKKSKGEFWIKFEIRLYSEFDFYNLIVQAFSKHFFDKYCLYCKNHFKEMEYDTPQEAINWALYKEYCRFLIGDSNRHICIFPQGDIYVDEKDVHLKSSKLLKIIGVIN